MSEPAEYLIRIPQEGYPTDYLLARIRSRRRELASRRPASAEARLQPQTESPPTEIRSTAPGVTALRARENMRHEFRWLYLQMNRKIRRSFAPVFIWFELRTMLISLRLRRLGAEVESAAALEDSLLAKRVLRVFNGVEEPFTGKDALSELLQGNPRQIKELGNWYRERKGMEYEERFLVLLLERLSREKLHPVLGEFFRSLVDLNNQLALAKQIRWQLHPPRPFASGGNIAPQRIEKARQEGEPGLVKLIRVRQGEAEAGTLPDNVENLLLARLTLKVRRLSEDTLGMGALLAYLWDCYLEARNASLMHHAAHLGEETLRAELVG